MRPRRRQLALLPALALAALGGRAQSPGELPAMTVSGANIATVDPASTYASPVSLLELEPRVDLQVRNFAEAQGDITIRGGIFHSTGMRVGAATLFDPQTGHFFGEIPIAPEMLSSPEVMTGADNALHGFNSTAGTVAYGWTPVQRGGKITVGGGTNNLNQQRLVAGWTEPFAEGGDWSWGIQGEFSRSEGDGSRTAGDHDFNRYSGRLELEGPRSKTDLFAGYQSKFFGWPELFAAPFGFNETENLKTRLIFLNHRQNYGAGSHWKFSAYYRRHNDHYTLSRANPGLFESFHETDVYASGLEGRHAFGPDLALRYSAQVTADDIESSRLEQGGFTSRSYVKTTVMPEYRVHMGAASELTLSAGMTYDDTNRDKKAFSPIAKAVYRREASAHASTTLRLSYSEATQVPSYTAFGGNTSGLFASTRGLGRSESKTLEAGVKLERRSWNVEATVFQRWDDGLVDWTFNRGSPNARKANPVDINTFGVELIGAKQLGDFEALASYTFLEKNDEDFGQAFDASFYSLNFPAHRATLAGIWTPFEGLEVRVDNEYRVHERNILRGGDDRGFFTHLTVSWFPSRVDGLELSVSGENLWKETFQEVPGTPGRGRQLAASATWRF